MRLEERLGIPSAETLALARGGAAAFEREHPYLRDVHAGSLEGYLFPKTYSFARGSSAEVVLKTMLEQFDKEIGALDLERAQAEGFSLHEVVTMASIIEREAALDRERPLIASVIRNRLERGMPLEIDATVEYVLPGNRFRLRYRDLKIDSPYNTYRVRGLPPGPIASPGLASLTAAIEPAKTDFLYYVL
ncbi:MAG: endolytic transglycosylase MltG, partial [Burkholderiaceae bacterium]|nr:endolytic transglycosylase MltG [Burkholderiaceae bacterium]